MSPHNSSNTGPAVLEVVILHILTLQSVTELALPLRLMLSVVKVLDNGTIQELDRPSILLQNKDGALYKMVQQMGQVEAAALLEAAR